MEKSMPERKKKMYLFQPRKINKEKHVCRTIQQLKLKKLILLVFERMVPKPKKKCVRLFRTISFG